MTYTLGSHIKKQAHDKGIPDEVVLTVANNEDNRTYLFIRKDGKQGECDRCYEKQVRREGKCDYNGKTYDIIVVLNKCCKRCVSVWHNGIAPLREDQIANGVTSFVHACEKCGVNIRFTADMKTQEDIDKHLASHVCRKPASERKPASYYKKKKKKGK